MIEIPTFTQKRKRNHESFIFYKLDMIIEKLLLSIFIVKFTAPPTG